MATFENRPDLEAHQDRDFRPELQNAPSAFEHVCNNALFSIGVNLKRLEKARAKGDSAAIEAKVNLIEESKTSFIQGLYWIKDAFIERKLTPNEILNEKSIQELIEQAESADFTNSDDFKLIEARIKSLENAQ